MRMRYTGHRASETNPLRSIPLYQPASVLYRAPVPVYALVLAMLVQTTPEQDLANAEARLRDAERVYDAARREIGEANARAIPATWLHGRMVTPARPFTAERIRERKSYAFTLFNKRRGQLSRARKAVDAARAVLGLPSLAIVAERQAIKDAVRDSKRQPVISRQAFALTAG